METIESIKALRDAAMDIQSQLNQALEILKKRDRQIDVALDGLENVIQDAPQALTHAKAAIDKMREIHNESLTLNPGT